MLQKINKAVEEVLKTAGFLPAVITAKQANIANASSCVSSNGNYYFLYNPEWFAKLNENSTDTEDWVIRYIVAHAVAHINLAHDLKAFGSNEKIELEADEYAGEILAKMGATLEQAQAALRSPLMKSNGSLTHPSTEKQLEAAEKGWKKGRNAIKQRN